MAKDPMAKPAPAKPAPAKPAAAGNPSSPSNDRLRDEMEPQEDMGGANQFMIGALAAAPSWLISMVFHVVLLLALALWVVDDEDDQNGPSVVSISESEESFEDLEELDDPIEELELPDELETSDVIIEEISEDMVGIADDLEAAPIAVELSNFGLDRAPASDIMSTIGQVGGKGLDGRGTKARAALVRKNGGSEGSEKAVAAALRWLAEHQMPDGGWSFNHAACPRCGGQCRNPGSAAKARRGATGMALLPFLGAGQTHMDGKYKATVKNGLYFLIQAMQFDPAKGGSWHEAEGNMYSHGIAAITLCEAYAMTHDKALHNPAQAGINFICYAQAADGGWRYKPKQAGDTSVVGWQIMALKSGHLAYLRVPPQVVAGASRYLDKVQAASGAEYGYSTPATGRHATTSIGLLCRMYLGWKKDHPGLNEGADRVSAWGPSDNVYYNYYATQVMRHVGGDRWTKWNNVMRDKLVNSQAKEGHETGSWVLGGGGHGNDRGGRLYHTAMCTMVLEVYYRHMPIYQSDAADQDFAE